MLFFDENNNNGYKFSDCPDLENVTQTFLNQIHSEFETYLTLFCDCESLLTNICNKNKSIENFNKYNRPELNRALNRVNNLIHNLEDLISGKEGNGLFFYKFKKGKRWR